MMKKNKNLYVYNSDSLIQLADNEGPHWLDIQKIEFNDDPNEGSFAYALKEYQKNKNLYVDINIIASIRGQNNNYIVMSNGLILKDL